MRFVKHPPRSYGLLYRFSGLAPLSRPAAPLRIDPESVRIAAIPEMLGRVDSPAARRFGRPSRDFDPGGFSDH